MALESRRFSRRLAPPPAVSTDHPDQPDRGERVTSSDEGTSPVPKLRVLHVTETFAAGTGMAIAGFAEAVSDQGFESMLLAQDRGSGLLDALGGSPPFSVATILPSGLMSLWKGIKPAVAAARPDVVHVHSSVAGVVVRLRMIGHAPPIVYSPHCFGFERRDLSRWMRRAVWLIERLLAPMTTAFVCVSPHEAQLAEGLGRKVRVVSLINCFDPAPTGVESTGPGPLDQAMRLVSVGRVAPQKDPGMLAAIVEAVRRAGVEVQATWVGTGDDEDARAALQAADVTLTGWVPPQQVLEIVKSQSVYVHTAAWEAGPIAVLDAMRAGIVVVVRRNDAYRDVIPSEWQFDDVPEAVAMIRTFCHQAAREARVRQQFATLAALAERGPRFVLPPAYRSLVGAGERLSDFAGH